MWSTVRKGDTSVKQNFLHEFLRQAPLVSVEPVVYVGVITHPVKEVTKNMSVDIDMEVEPQNTHPVKWSDAVTDILYMTLAIVCAYPLMPILVERAQWSTAFGIVFSSFFGLMAVLHLRDAVNVARTLRKQKAEASA
jgi:hypothetical protein